MGVTTNWNLFKAVSKIIDDIHLFSKTWDVLIFKVDEFLDNLTNFSKEDDQMRELRKITKKCTVNDLKYIIRLIKHDLRMNTGAKHV